MIIEKPFTIQLLFRLITEIGNLDTWEFTSFLEFRVFWFSKSRMSILYRFTALWSPTELLENSIKTLCIGFESTLRIISLAYPFLTHFE